MRQANIVGSIGAAVVVHQADLDAEPSDDLVNRVFDPAEPDHLWVMDVTEHPTSEGKVYLAVALDAFSRRGWWAGPSPITSAPKPRR